jgi:hypothetical protein
MKNEFLEKLEKDEKLLYYGVSNVSKTSRQLWRFLLGFVVLTIFWISFIIGFKGEDINFFEIVILFIILIILTLSLIYGFIYNVLLKYKNKSNEYFITNKRVALYDVKNGFKIRNILDIEHIGIAREKDNYGDISFAFYANNLLEQMKNGLSFEGVENPRKIVETVINVNKNIHVYDDKPIIMGKKID